MEHNAPWIKNYGDIPFHLDYPKGTMWDCFAKSAKEAGDFAALSYMGKEYGYKAVKELIERTAKAFTAIGVAKGTRVALCLPNIPQAVFCLYALNKIGAVAAMIHPLSAELELTELLAEAGCDYAVIMDSFAKKFADAEEKLPHIRYIVTNAAEHLNFIKSIGYSLAKGRKFKNSYPKNSIKWKAFMKSAKVAKEAEAATNDPLRPALILFSGGTTGVPKAIALSNNNVNAMSTQINAVSKGITKSHRMLAALPIFHGFGLGVCIHAPLINGGTSVLVPRVIPGEFAKLIEKTKANFFAGVPSLFEALIRSDYSPKLNNLMGVYSGGDSMSTELRRKVNEYLKSHGAAVRVQEGYGATECFAASCLTPYFSTKDEGIGFPFPDTYFIICKPDSEEQLPFNTDGEICLRGPAVMLGYLGHEDENATVLRRHADGYIWLHTGDMGYMDEDGCVYFRQRLKRMIVTNGYNVYPSRVEGILNSHPKVSQCCVIGVPDSRKMQIIKAYIVCEDKDCDKVALRAELFEHCKKSIAKYAMPYQIEFIEALPKTKLGKIDYTALERY